MVTKARIVCDATTPPVGSQMSTARVATLTLALTGQALIERDLRSVRHSGLDRVIDVLRHADLTFTNLESAVAGRHESSP